MSDILRYIAYAVLGLAACGAVAWYILREMRKEDARQETMTQEEKDDEWWRNQW